MDLETILLGAKISNVMHAHIINIFDELDDNQVFGRQEVMEITGCGKTQASKILNVMKMNNVIVDVIGKGKYVFRRNLCEEEKEMAKMDSLDTFIGFVHE